MTLGHRSGTLSFSSSLSSIAGRFTFRGLLVLLFTQCALAQETASVRLREIEAGQQRQEEIRSLLHAFGKDSEQKLFKDRKEFLTALRDSDRSRVVLMTGPELKAVLAALSDRDETAEICRDKDGQSEPDVDRRADRRVHAGASFRGGKFSFRANGQPDFFGEERLHAWVVPGARFAPMQPRPIT